MNSLFSLFILTTVVIATTFDRSKAEAHERTTVRYVKSVYSLPVSLDPAQMNDGASLVFSELVYEGLLRLTPDYGFEGALAESWSTSPDGKALTFTLKKNAIFHDGAKITSQDVVASLTRVVGPHSKVFSYFDVLDGAKEFRSGKRKSVAGLKAINERTVEIRLSKPFPPFMYVLAGATAKVLPFRAATEAGFFNRPIGSGPFSFARIESTAPRKQLVLRRSQESAPGSGNIQEFVLEESTEDEARKLGLKGDIHDLSSWPLTGTEEVFAVGQHLTSPVAHTWIIGLNTRLGPFKDLNMRRLFKSQFDSESFRKKFYPDAVPSFGYIPPGFPGFIREKNDSRKVDSKAPRSKLVVTIPQGLAQEAAIKSFIEESMKLKGWNIAVNVLPWNELMRAYEAKSLQAFLVSMNVDYPDSEFLLRNFESGNPDNFSGTKDQVLNDLLARARMTVDRVKREAIYKKAAERLEELAPTVNLFHPRAHIWIHKCVRGFEPSLLAEAYIRYQNVSLDEACLKDEAGAK